VAHTQARSSVCGLGNSPASDLTTAALPAGTATQFMRERMIDEIN
jgi:hypothetical protein